MKKSILYIILLTDWSVLNNIDFTTTTINGGFVSSVAWSVRVKVKLSTYRDSLLLISRCHQSVKQQMSCNQVH